MQRHRTGLRQQLCAAAVALAAGAPALANPNGPTVVNGQASFQVNGKTLTVTNTPGAIINWQGFSISADELTRFLQQSPVSAVLNRVVGANPSEILGRLQSNGRVFLVNPNGIVFGPGSQVDVAALAASTLNISNADFLAGRHAFGGTGAEGRITHQGEIVTPAGGKVFLVAPQVESSGIIRAPSGDIVLAAGTTVRIVDANFPSIQVEVSATGGKDLPLGNLAAAGGGKVFAFVVRQSGVVSASGASVADGGRVVLKSAGEVQLAAGSRTEAAGAAVGGSVAVEAPRILVAFNGAIDVSGAAGGGRAALVGAQVLFAGTIDARATRTGDGGSVEVSGTPSLVFAGTVDTRAAAGRDGTLLIDPAQLTVVAGSTGVPAAAADGTWSSGEGTGSQAIGAVEVSNLLQTTSVTLQATERVVVAADAVIEAGAPGRRLTLQAPQVVFQGTIRTAAAPVDLRIEAQHAQVTEGARLALGGGQLAVQAPAASVAPAQEAQRPRARESMDRAATLPSPDADRLRAEVQAEIERDNARLAAAMSRSCAKPGAPQQGCTVGGGTRRFAFSG